MRRMLAFRIGLATLLVATAMPGSAEPLTAARVATLAATTSPGARIAATHVDEARGRLAGAGVLATENPRISGVRNSERTTIELEVPFGLGPRRWHRVAEARAGVEQEEYLEIDARARVVAAALDAYYRVLHAEQHLAIARDRRDLARDLARIATDRFEAGDAARLEVLVVDGELSRAEGDVLARQRDVTQTRSRLVTILGLSSVDGMDVAGDLADRSFLDAVVSGAPEQRADVLAAERNLRARQAAASLAGTWPIPDVAFRLDYEEEGDDEVFSPGVALSIPIFDRGQGPRGESRARRDRAAIELEALRASAAVEKESARTAYASMAAAAREIEQRALPRALEVEGLAREGYEAGKLDLPALLLVRNSSLETRTEYIDRLLEAAEAAIELALVAGALPQQPEPKEGNS